MIAIESKNSLLYSDYIFAYALEVEEHLWGSIAASPIPFEQWKLRSGVSHAHHLGHHKR
jgi:hypothetical protein